MSSLINTRGEQRLKEAREMAKAASQSTRTMYPYTTANHVITSDGGNLEPEVTKEETEEQEDKAEGEGE